VVAPKNNQQGAGLTGALGGIKTIGQLQSILDSRYLPVSLMIAPGATGSDGRVTLLTTANTPATSTRPTDGKVATLAAGTYTWTFVTKFNSPPIVQVTAVGVPPIGPSPQYLQGIVYIVAGSVTTTSVQVASTYATDVRQIHLFASGNPS